MEPFTMLSSDYVVFPFEKFFVERSKHRDLARYPFYFQAIREDHSALFEMVVVVCKDVTKYKSFTLEELEKETMMKVSTKKGFVFLETNNDKIVLEYNYITNTCSFFRHGGYGTALYCCELLGIL